MKTELNILQRLFGICATKKPSDPQCWKVNDDNNIEIDLNKAIELKQPGSAIRLEDKQLNDRLLICHGTDNNYYAFVNKCKHMGRRLDPIPETKTIQCCSIGKTTYDYAGTVLSGSAKDKLDTLSVDKTTDKLIIRL